MGRKMFTVLLTMLLSLNFSSVTHAQVGYQPLKPHFAVKAGLNATSLSIDRDYVVEKAGRVTPYFGLVGKFPITKEFAYRQELTMTFRGGDARYNLEYYTGTKDYRLTYLDAPILFQYDFLHVLHVHGGGYVSYLLDTDLTYNGKHTDFVRHIEQDDLMQIDAGISIGGGITFEEIIEFGVRYNYGLIELANDQEEGAINAEGVLPQTQNRFLQIYMSFWFSELDFKKMFRQGELKL